jgi:hypothetical protein
MTTQVNLRQWPGMQLTWLGCGAVVHSGARPGSGAAALVTSPQVGPECTVVVSSHDVRMLPGMVEELATVVGSGMPRGVPTVRLVAWDGACVHGERPAAAQLLANRLGIDVLSPAGPLLGVPGGSLFAPPGRGAHRPGGWWRFRSGGSPVRVGWRFPAPRWEADLGMVDDAELPGDLLLEHVPAGLWLHRRGHTTITDLAYSVPIDQKHPALILAHPAEAPLQRDELGRGIGAIPALTTDRLVYTPYGQHPTADGPVGPVMADLLGRAVHARTGLPLCAPEGQRAVVTIDGKGLPRWRTFARELWYAPRESAPRAVDWTNPAPDVLTVPAGAATFALGGGWVVEVIAAGVWLRPERQADTADWVRAIAVDVDQCAIVVGTPLVHELPPPAHMVCGLLERMPLDARRRAYLAIPDGVPQEIFALATTMRRQLPDTGEVRILHAPRGVDHRMPVPAGAPVGGGWHDERRMLVPEPPVPVVPAARYGDEELTTGSHRVIAPPRPFPHEETTGSHRLIEPAVYVPETPTDSQPAVTFDVPHREIRSHRTAGKAGKRDDDKTSTQELNRLLGFFDEIRRAKAWDEESGWAGEAEPEAVRPPAPRRATRR